MRYRSEEVGSDLVAIGRRLFWGFVRFVRAVAEWLPLLHACVYINSRSHTGAAMCRTRRIVSEGARLRRCS